MGGEFARRERLTRAVVCQEHGSALDGIHIGGWNADICDTDGTGVVDPRIDIEAKFREATGDG
jgi:hypothetical protein